MSLLELVEELPLASAQPALLEPDQVQGQLKAAAGDDHRGSLERVGPELPAELCEQVLAGGAQHLIDLIALIQAPGELESEDRRAEHLLHGVVRYVRRPEREEQRQSVVAALASQLANPELPLAVRQLLVRALQGIGSPQAVVELGKLLHHDDLCHEAVLALAEIGTGADRVLAEAVAKATGRNRLALIQSVAIRADERSVDMLRPLLMDPDADVRLAAAWGLAKLADTQSTDLLLELADSTVNYQRMKATHACLMLAERLAARGNTSQAVRIYTHLRDTRRLTPETYIRNVAENALRALATEPAAPLDQPHWRK